jgi:hypothetical protein
MDGILGRLTKNSDLVLAIGLVGILSVMVIPMPTWLIDMCITLAIAGSIVLLLTAVYTQRALDFSIFPFLLLIATLFRLALNVATTRVILLYGAEKGAFDAGHVIESVGKFVVGGCRRQDHRGRHRGVDAVELVRRVARFSARRLRRGIAEHARYLGGKGRWRRRDLGSGGREEWQGRLLGRVPLERQGSVYRVCIEV